MGKKTGGKMITNSITKNNHKIDKIEITPDILTSRGGLNLFCKYIDKIGIITILSGTLSSIKKNKKGFKIYEMIKQIICFLVDGTSRNISYFNILKQDKGYAGTIELSQKMLYSSFSVFRFFDKFNYSLILSLRSVLNRLFIWRLKLDNEKIIFIYCDTMAMNNNDAKCREAVHRTYRKFWGFQPLNFIWNGKIIDTVFRGGSKNGNSGKAVEKSIISIVKQIRSEYSKEAEIVFLFDAGFFDDKLYKLLENLNVWYIATGKMYNFSKEIISLKSEDEFKIFTKEKLSWEYCEFKYKCKTWNDERRAIFTRLRAKEDGQLLFSFAKPNRIILTNITKESSINIVCPDIYKSENIIKHFHSTGTFELVHRSIKEFRDEKFPFKGFIQNSTFYNLVIISHFLFICFQEDHLDNEISGIIPGSYPNTIRRIFFDFAAKITKTGQKIFLKVSSFTIQHLKLEDLWKTCQIASPHKI